MMLFFPKALRDSGTYQSGSPILAFICRMIFEAADIFLAGCGLESVLLLIT